MLCQCVKLTLCIVVMLFLYSESLFNPRSPLKRPVEIELILESAIFKSTNWFIPWKTVSGRKLMWLVSTSRIFSLVKLRMLGGRRVSQVLVMWSSCNKIENLTIGKKTHKTKHQRENDVGVQNILVIGKKLRKHTNPKSNFCPKFNFTELLDLCNGC